jgi:hypothetical protein
MQDEYFKELNVDDIKPKSKLLLIGPLNFKHENIIADLFENYDDEFVSNSLIISPPNAVLKTLYPSVTVDDEYSAESIMLNLHNSKHNAIVLYMHTYIKDDAVTEMILNGRHYFKDVVVIIQHPMDIPPSIRNQFDYVFISHYNDPTIQKNIYSAYCGAFPTFYMFQTAFNGITSTGDLIVILQSWNSSLTDNVFWYSLPEIEMPTTDISCDDNTDDYLTVYI